MGVEHFKNTFKDSLVLLMSENRKCRWVGIESGNVCCCSTWSVSCSTWGRKCSVINTVLSFCAFLVKFCDFSSPPPSFQVGDLVLIILDERHDNYVLFTVSPTLYFLHSESLAALDLKPGECGKCQIFF